MGPYTDSSREMTADAQREAIKKLIRERTKEITASKQKARQYLIDSGFHTASGELTARYGGKKRTAA